MEKGTGFEKLKVLARVRVSVKERERKERANSKGSVTTAGCGVIRQDSVRNTGKAKVMFRRPHSIQKSKKHAQAHNRSCLNLGS